VTSREAPQPKNLDRYVRQIRYPPLGAEGQTRLCDSSVLLCGCGALGSMIASVLVRAGVGHVRIVDRDFVEISNLQRQFLFDEQDVAEQLPKAVAAAEKLRLINSEVQIEPIVADIHAGNLPEFAEGADAIVDGMDNFETRFLINDLAVQRKIPWVYGGCLGAEGQTMTILPGETPCLRCLIQDCPPPGTMPTCDTAGILGPIVGMIASLEAMEAIKILSGRREAISRYLTVVELWDACKESARSAATRSCCGCASIPTRSPSSPTAARSSAEPATCRPRGRCTRSTWDIDTRAKERVSSPFPFG
jgi:adenylyltransferase/sulfurtransferase